MAIDQDFIDEYLGLLIIQYSDKPKAVAEITLKASEYSKIFDFYKSFFNAFDLDLAVGDQLTIIGKIVGIPRIVPFSLAKKYFGFSNNPNSLSFGEGTFFDKFTDVAFADTELSDVQMRLLIRAKIAKNTTSPYMVSDDRVSLQDVIRVAFENRAFVVDGYDMTLSLYIDINYQIDNITLIKSLNLLPSPQGVGYKRIVQYEPDETFGFSDNPNAKGFGAGILANGII